MPKMTILLGPSRKANVFTQKEALKRSVGLQSLKLSVLLSKVPEIHFRFQTEPAIQPDKLQSKPARVGGGISRGSCVFVEH